MPIKEKTILLTKTTKKHSFQNAWMLLLVTDNTINEFRQITIDRVRTGFENVHEFIFDLLNLVALPANIRQQKSASNLVSDELNQQK